jgi:hypothetical protein
VPRQNRTILGTLDPPGVALPQAVALPPAAPVEAIAAVAPPPVAEPVFPQAIAVPAAPSVRQPGTSFLARCGSPGVLIFTFLLLPLPFLDIRCEPNMILGSQSGLQIIYGGATPAKSSDKADGFSEKGRDKTGDTIHAGVLFVFILLLFLAAAVIGLVLPLGRLRLLAVGSPLGLALILLYVQLGIGFPIDRQIQEELGKSDAKAKAGEPGGRLAGAGAVIGVRYTAWFWIWLVLLHLAPLVLAAEAAMPGLLRQANAQGPQPATAELRPPSGTLVP